MDCVSLPNEQGSSGNPWPCTVNNPRQMISSGFFFSLRGYQEREGSGSHLLTRCGCFIIGNSDSPAAVPRSTRSLVTNNIGGSLSLPGSLWME